MINHTNFDINTLSKEQIQKSIDSCPLNFAMGKIGGKWKPIILHRIKIGVNRFGQLQRSIPLIIKQMLTAQLRELEEDQLIHRQVFAEVPPRVEYSITENGETLFPVLEALEQWGRKQQTL